MSCRSVPSVVADRPDVPARIVTPWHPRCEVRIAQPASTLERFVDRDQVTEGALGLIGNADLDGPSPPVVAFLDEDEAGAVEPHLCRVVARRHEGAVDHGGRAGLLQRPSGAVPILVFRFKPADWNAGELDLDRALCEAERSVVAELLIAVAIQVGVFTVAGDGPAVEVVGGRGFGDDVEHIECGRIEDNPTEGGWSRSLEVGGPGLVHLDDEEVHRVAIYAQCSVENPVPPEHGDGRVGEQPRCRSAIEQRETSSGLDQSGVVDE